MNNIERIYGVIISRLFNTYKSIKRFYGLYERFIIMYIPFISSFLYCVNVYMFYTKEFNDMFIRYNANLSGHSIFWLQAYLSRSKNMCKWYKGSVILSMITHILNIMFYHGYVDMSIYIALSFSIAIISILCWLIFRVTYKATKSIRSACKRLETE